MQISDVIEAKGRVVYTVQDSATVKDVLHELNTKHIGALVVVDDKGGIEGIVSERDILKQIESCEMEHTAKEIMTPKDKLIIGHMEDDLEYAMSMFTAHKIRHLPIVEKDKLVGMVSIGDAVKALLSNVEYEKKALMDYITGSYAQ